MPDSLVRYQVAAALLLSALAATARAQPAGPGGGAATENGRQWALLIGVEKYQKARPLAYTVNDVKILANILRTRNGFGDGELATFTDNEANPRQPPYPHQPAR